MTFTTNTPVADIAAEIPSSVAVFQRYGIDFCCGGRAPLGLACRERGLDVAEVSRAIDNAAAARNRNQRDWTRAPLHVLIDHAR